MSTDNKKIADGVEAVHPAYAAASLKWKRARAILGGQDAAKKHDLLIDTKAFTNLLVPFSPKMSQEQYNFYLAEAELPGVSAQFFKILIGTLMKTTPEVIFPDSVSEQVKEWINHHFGQDDSSLGLFMRASLEEELTTTRAWVFIDRPNVITDDINESQKDQYRPFPTLWKAEEIINWRFSLNADGKRVPSRIVLSHIIEVEDPENEFNTIKRKRFTVHELVNKLYQVRVFTEKAGGKYDLDTKDKIFYNGKRLDYIPVWPVNGSFEVAEPALATFIDKEVSLYNKISRRNHLLYGAATYTPYVKSDMSPEKFQTIVDAGLGAWFQIGKEDDAGVLEPPTVALQDYDRAILAAMDELAKLGIRIMTPEMSQSGVALEIRNAAQTSQIGFLSELLSLMFSRIIVFMVNWRFNLNLTETDVTVKVNNNFLRQAVSIQWAQLVTDWYEARIIPRSLWLSVIKSSELLPADYDDVEGQKEIDKSPNNLDGNPNDPNSQDTPSPLDKLLNKGK